MAKKKTIQKYRLGRRTIILLLIGIGILILCLAYTKAFLPKSDAPAEISDKPSEFKFAFPKKEVTTPEEIDRNNIVPEDLGNQEIGIPELGIKLKLPEGIKDLVYYKSSPNGVYFSTVSLTSLETYCVASRAPLGYFARIEKSELAKGNPSGNWRSNETELKKLSKERLDSSSGQIMPPMTKEFDKFYILFEGPQATCSEDKSVQNLQSSQTRILQSVIPSTELL